MLPWGTVRSSISAYVEGEVEGVLYIPERLIIEVSTHVANLGLDFCSLLETACEAGQVVFYSGNVLEKAKQEQTVSLGKSHTLVVYQLAARHVLQTPN